MSDDEIIDFVDMMLEDESFEELLERFDVTPQEAFVNLFTNGLIDYRLLKELMGR